MSLTDKNISFEKYQTSIKHFLTAENLLKYSSKLYRTLCNSVNSKFGFITLNLESFSLEEKQTLEDMDNNERCRYVKINGKLERKYTHNLLDYPGEYSEFKYL